MKSFNIMLLIIVLGVQVFGQTNNVGIGTSTPDPSAILDLMANDKGLLLPRLTSAQRCALPNPSNGLLVYDLDSLALFVFSGSPLRWKSLKMNQGSTSAQWYRDEDNDGFGDAAVSLLSCDKPFGYVENSIDCDDTNPTRYLGAIEICDGIDNDCDGQNDENFDLTTNLNNCGGCGQVCFIPNAQAQCFSGVCIFIGCQTGFVDANNNLSDGCEVNLVEQKKCFIDGVLYSKNQQNPSNPCEICLPSESTTTWSLTLVCANLHSVPRWNGSKLISGNIMDNGTETSIGTSPIQGQRLTVQGKTSTTNLQITNGASNGKLLQSDALGNATWVDPILISINETDPQVSMTEENSIPKWNGVFLENGSIKDQFGAIGINATPDVNNKLTVGGTIKADGLRLPIGWQNGFILGSNSSDGFVEWKNIAKIETDPQISSIIHGRVPRYNAVNATMVDGSILDYGNNVIEVSGDIFTQRFKMSDGAATGLVLHSSNEFGNAEWINVSSLESDPKINMGPSDIGRSVRWDGTKILPGSMIDGGNGIVLTEIIPDQPVLFVDGVLSTKRLKIPLPFMSPNPDGKVLKSDINGEVTLQSESDPKVSLLNMNRVGRWNGSTLTDGAIQDDATNVGIGTAPVTNQKLTVSGKTTTTNLQMTNGAASGMVLQSDASGNGTWVNPTTLSITEADPQVSSTTNGKIPRWDGSSLSDGTIQDDATNVGIGTAPVTNQKLTVSGKTTTTNLQMTNGAASGMVLQSDASGNGTWVNPTTLSITEADPQVSSTTTGKIPRWDGSSLSDGTIQDDATNIGIGTAPVTNQKLTVSGKTTTTNLQMTNGAASGMVLQSDATGNGTWVNANTLTTNNIYNANGTLTSARNLTQGSNAFIITNNGTQNTTINLSSSGDFDIQDNGTSAFKVQDDGKIGINQSTPLAGLHIKGVEATFDAHIRLESAADADYGNILYDGNMKFKNFGVGDEYQWRNSANNIRMRLFDSGDLTISGNANVGGLTLNSGSVSLTGDDQVVTVGSGSYLKLSSNNSTAASRTIVFSDGLNAGQILYVESTSIGANLFEILDGAGSNTNTSGAITMSAGDIIQLLWNGADWLQVSYSNN